MKRKPTITRNLIIIALVLMGWYVVIGARLAYLQLINGHLLLARSHKNFLRQESIPSMRGTIRDRNGVELATNRPSTNIYWQGTGNTKLSDKQHALLEKIEPILGISIIDNTTTYRTLNRTERQYKKQLLAEDITHQQLSQIAEVTAQEKNIVIATTFKRFYPCGTTACHLLGYLGRMDMHFYGKMGLENLFEDTLKGQSGVKLKTINSVGTSLSESEIEKALNGGDLNLTLDYTLQQIAESVFPENYSGTLIVMDPEDGSLYALLSRPDFDPAFFLQSIERPQWLALQEKKPFLNRAFNACYPPGSIFKLITLTAALEKQIINQHDTWYCAGYVEFCQRKYRCNNRWGHGTVTIHEALAHSCNTLFYDIGKKISIDTLAHYAFQYGLGKKTPLLFAQKEGLVPTNEWKKRTKGERWWPGETLSATIGQSYILVTPIQIAGMISSIFTGSVPAPRVVQSDPISKSPLNVDKKTRKFLQKSMEMVVQTGTGRRIKHVDDFKIFGKTSTAQTSSLEKRDLGETYKEHGWFTAYFQYKDNRPLVIVCLVEHAGSSRIPADCAKAFFKEYKIALDTNRLVL